MHVAFMCQGFSQWLEINYHRQINPVLPRMTHLKAYTGTNTHRYPLQTHTTYEDFSVSEMAKLHPVRMIHLSTLGNLIILRRTGEICPVKYNCSDENVLIQ